MSTIFPRTVPAARAAIAPVASAEAITAARLAVRELVQRTKSFEKLAPKQREEFAKHLVQIGTYLAEPEGERVKPSPQVLALAEGDSLPPQQQQKFGTALRAGVEQAGALMAAVNFPQFVTSLINGVFHSIVTSSIEQMEAYAKLVADVSKSLNQFRDDNTTQNQGRDHLVEQFPDMLQLSMDTGAFDTGGFGNDSGAAPGPRVVLRDGVDERSAIDRLNSSLPLDKPITHLDDELVEAVLVPAARTQIATGRQQLLATMVMLGINRIVVTDGRISAKVMYDFQARDNRKYRYSATQFDHEKDAYGNLQKTSDYSGEYEYKREGGSTSGDQTTDPSYYSKGNYKYAEQPVVKLMSASQLQDDSSLQAKASLAGQVDVNFKSDYLPLDKLANPDAIAAIQMNAQPGMVRTLANRPPAPAPAQTGGAAAPAPAPAATTPPPIR